ncbi:heme binding [Lobosporangium transversale]|nr:heme binding [Lobosporangium transversale]
MLPENAIGFILVALCWGFTNPFIKNGSKGLETIKRNSWISQAAAEYWYLFTRWQYVVPLVLNLCGSVVYYHTLGKADLSLAVPITNSLTFIFTTLAGILLGESIGSPRKSVTALDEAWTIFNASFSTNVKSPFDPIDLLGEITIELYTEHAPKTCKNFYELARKGYYNDVIFHRIIPDFMIQGGDPTGTGRGGSSIYGDKFADEFHPALKHTGAGILSMANSGPNTNGSQFFITLAPTPWLDNKHTIFGRVSAGLRVVNRMGLVATDSNDRPKELVKIIRARAE